MRKGHYVITLVYNIFGNRETRMGTVHTIFDVFIRTIHTYGFLPISVSHVYDLDKYCICTIELSKYIVMTKKFRENILHASKCDMVVYARHDIFIQSVIRYCDYNYEISNSSGFCSYLIRKIYVSKLCTYILDQCMISTLGCTSTPSITEQKIYMYNMYMDNTLTSTMSPFIVHSYTSSRRSKNLAKYISNIFIYCYAFIIYKYHMWCMYIGTHMYKAKKRKEIDMYRRYLRCCRYTTQWGHYLGGLVVQGCEVPYAYINNYREHKLSCTSAAFYWMHFIFCFFKYDIYTGKYYFHKHSRLYYTVSFYDFIAEHSNYMHLQGKNLLAASTCTEITSGMNISSNISIKSVIVVNDNNAVANMKKGCSTLYMITRYDVQKNKFIYSDMVHCTTCSIPSKIMNELRCLYVGTTVPANGEIYILNALNHYRKKRNIIAPRELCSFMFTSDILFKLHKFREQFDINAYYTQEIKKIYKKEKLQIYKMIYLNRNEFFIRVIGTLRKTNISYLASKNYYYITTLFCSTLNIRTHRIESVSSCTQQHYISKKIILAISKLASRSIRGIFRYVDQCSNIKNILNSCENTIRSLLMIDKVILMYYNIKKDTSGNINHYDTFSFFLNKYEEVQLCNSALGMNMLAVYYIDMFIVYLNTVVDNEYFCPMQDFNYVKRAMSEITGEISVMFSNCTRFIHNLEYYAVNQAMLAMYNIYLYRNLCLQKDLDDQERTTNINIIGKATLYMVYTEIISTISTTTTKIIIKFKQENFHKTVCETNTYMTSFRALETLPVNLMNKKIYRIANNIIATHVDNNYKQNPGIITLFYDELTQKYRNPVISS